MIVLICGGRNFNDYMSLKEAMRMLPFSVSMIVQGGSKGADSLGKKWALENKVHYAEVPALWNCFGNSAGPLRNSTMLKLKPDYCVAMPGGRGTQDMVRKCIDAGVTVWKPYKSLLCIDGGGITH